jgi:hypothetical protein
MMNSKMDNLEELISLIETNATLGGILKYNQQNNIDLSNIINMFDSCDETMLHTAVKHKRVDLVRWLLDEGADTTLVNYWGSTAYQSAEKMKSLDICNAFLDDKKSMGTAQSLMEKLKFNKYLADETGMTLEEVGELLLSISEQEKEDLFTSFKQKKRAEKNSSLMAHEPMSQSPTINVTQDTNHLPTCPECNSKAVSVNTQKYGVGKALVGTLLTGGVGLLAGGIGRNNLKLTCLDCGKKWTI